MMRVGTPVTLQSPEETNNTVEQMQHLPKQVNKSGYRSNPVNSMASSLANTQVTSNNFVMSQKIMPNLILPPNQAPQP
jgi:hypothetical protein